MKPLEPAVVLIHVVLGEFDHQKRRRGAANRLLDCLLEDRNRPAELDHRVVDKLDGDRIQRDQMLRRVHRLVETRKMADPHQLAGRQRPEPEFDGGAEGKRAFRADEKMRQVDPVAGLAAGAKRHGVGHQRIDIISPDPAKDLRKPVKNVLPVRLSHGKKPWLQLGKQAGRRGAGDVAEPCLRPVGHDGLDGGDIVAHHAVADRPPAAAVVSGHAADGGAARRRDIDREPQTVRLQLTVELVKNDSRLDNAAPRLDIELEDPVEMPAGIDHHGIVDRLPALRRAAATRQHGKPFAAREGKRRLDVLQRFRHHDGMRHHLVDRRVGGVPAAREQIVEKTAAKFGFQRGKGGYAGFVGHGLTRKAHGGLHATAPVIASRPQTGCCARTAKNLGYRPCHSNAKDYRT